ncbi:hypothetical protein ACNS7O_07070 [Haloferacaceae archaeon DSL9]
MNGRYGTMDYKWLTKTGVGLGFALLALGAIGELLGRTMFAPLPEWEHLLFTSMEFGGIVTIVISVFVFGIALPLTE